LIQFSPDIRCEAIGKSTYAVFIIDAIEVKMKIKPFRIYVSVLLIVILLLSMADVAHDAMEGADLSHLTLEFLLMGVVTVGLIWLFCYFLQERRAVLVLKHRLGILDVERQEWQQKAEKYVFGLSEAIESQFKAWGFTPAEIEVGFVLLKGYSLNEIASFRQTSVKTVNVQTQSVYKKAGLSNRSEFSAYFLEDLLPPVQNTLIFTANK
jgi:DNA-binding CsgD family transcriptional regulator